MKTKCAPSRTEAGLQVERASPHIQTPRRILRFSQVSDRVGLSRSTIWRMTRNHEFPANVRLTSGHAVGWIEDQVDAWLRQRCRE